jgi:hypothetical protein
MTEPAPGDHVEFKLRDALMQMLRELDAGMPGFVEARDPPAGKSFAEMARAILLVSGPDEVEWATGQLNDMLWWHNKKNVSF